MKKELILTVASVALTLAVALALIRWFAPGLLGYAVDQQLVQTSEEVPPFYENVFRASDLTSDKFLLPDPSVVIRGKPLFPDMLKAGPHDVLGFRNRGVPNAATIVTIGDSQTYGNNAPLEFSWPGQLQSALYGNGRSHVYNMSVGAWGGVNYRRIMESALRLQPKVVVVAFYTGNDSISDFRNVYSIDDLAHLRVNPDLDVDDLPKIVFPPPADETVKVAFADGIETAFTPRYRLHANRRSDPTVVAGYAIMEKMAAEMAARLAEAGVAGAFTIIPTKELAYAKKVAAGNINVNDEYRQLVSDEKRNLDELAAAIRKLPNVTYVDVLGPIQKAALTDTILYPESGDGHPIAAGYGVIGRAVAAEMDPKLVARPAGFYGLSLVGVVPRLVIINDEGQWSISRPEVIEGNGWSTQKVHLLPIADVANIPYRGELVSIDPARFGPEEK